MAHKRLQPEALFSSSQYGFSQVVRATGGKHIFCAGQTAWDKDQNIIGPGDFRQQIKKTLENVEAALNEALESGHVARAAFDVYKTEPPGDDFILRNQPHMVMTPHLGASTAEAQENVGIEIAQSIREYLLDGTICNAVNIPNVDAKTLEVLHPYLELGEKNNAHSAFAKIERLYPFASKEKINTARMKIKEIEKQLIIREK